MVNDTITALRLQLYSKFFVPGTQYDNISIMFDNRPAQTTGSVNNSSSILHLWWYNVNSTVHTR